MRRESIIRAAAALFAGCMVQVPSAFATGPAGASQQPLRLAESSKGVVFSVLPAAIQPHPLGHVVRMQGHSARPQLLDGSEPASATYRAVESTWVVACHAGTYAIVLDRFLDESGDTVAVFTESPHEQQAPEPGSLAATVFRRICEYVGRGAPKPGAGF